MCLFSFFWAVDINTKQKWGNLRLVLFYAYSPSFPISSFWSSLSFCFFFSQLFLSHSPFWRCLCCASSLLFFQRITLCFTYCSLLAGHAFAFSLVQPALWPFTSWMAWDEVSQHIPSSPKKLGGRASWKQMLVLSLVIRLFKFFSFFYFLLFFLAFCIWRQHASAWPCHCDWSPSAVLCVGVPLSSLLVFPLCTQNRPTSCQPLCACKEGGPKTACFHPVLFIWDVAIVTRLKHCCP